MVRFSNWTHRLDLAVLALSLGLISWAGGDLKAHEVQPSIIDLEVQPGQTFRLIMQLNLEAVMAELGEGHADTSDAPGAADYDRLRALNPDDLRAAFDAFRPRFLEGLTLLVDGTPVAPFVEQITIPDAPDLDLPRESRLVIAGALNGKAKTLVWQWAPEFGAVILRQRNKDGALGYSAYLTGGSASDEIDLPQKSFFSLW